MQKGRALLTGVCLCVCYSGAQAQVSAEAVQAYQQQYWRTAIKLLEPQKGEAGAMRMLALAYFHMQDFARALPFLQRLRAYLDRERERPGPVRCE